MNIPSSEGQFRYIVTLLRLKEQQWVFCSQLFVPRRKCIRGSNLRRSVGTMRGHVSVFALADSIWGMCIMVAYFGTNSKKHYQDRTSLSIICNMNKFNFIVDIGKGGNNVLC